jgi:hypothetical protein
MPNNIIFLDFDGTDKIWEEVIADKPKTIHLKDYTPT